MDRYGCCLMFIFVFCLLPGCNTAGMSSTAPQQASGNEGPFIGRNNLEIETVACDQGEAEKSMGISNFPEQNVETAPFAEERFAYRPTRAGGMPTLLHPKGVPYSENTPLSARE